MQVAAPPKGSISVGMVVGLVLEEEQPVLILAVDVAPCIFTVQALISSDSSRSVRMPCVFSHLRADGAHVHEADGLVLAAQLVAHGHDSGRRRPARAASSIWHVVQHGAEGGVAAVIGPVGVDHLDLGDGGVAASPQRKYSWQNARSPRSMARPVLVDELLQARLVQLVEAVQHLHRRRARDSPSSGWPRCLERSLAGLHRVDDVLLDRLPRLLVGQGAFQQVDAGRAHQRALALADELDALGGRVGALVELAGQVLHGEHDAPSATGSSA